MSQPTLGLSVREFEIFRLVASGKTHEEIAAMLNLSLKTVANNHSLIRQKLGIDCITTVKGVGYKFEL